MGQAGKEKGKKTKNVNTHNLSLVFERNYIVNKIDVFSPLWGWRLKKKSCLDLKLGASTLDYVDFNPPPYFQCQIEMLFILCKKYSTALSDAHTLI